MNSPVAELESLIDLFPFFGIAHQLYDGTSGLYDYDDLGVKLLRNIRRRFEQRYVFELEAFEYDGTILAPSRVFQGSGHQERFIDLEQRCDQCQLLFKDQGTTHCETCGQVLSSGVERRLMFSFDQFSLRPETVQSIFTNYERLSINRVRPFVIVQFGKGFRNEISPRQGLLRLRELNMCEILSFDDRSFEDQMIGYQGRYPMQILDAEGNESSLVPETNEHPMIGCRLLRYLQIGNDLLQELGLDSARLRFRQHRIEERAHYSVDTWDAEARLSGRGWVEIAGFSDRGQSDFLRHLNFLNRQTTDVEDLPRVIESSYGMDRILYAVMDHGLDSRGLSFVTELAPISVAIGPVVRNNQQILEQALRLFKQLRDRLAVHGRAVIFRDKGSIGRRYHETDRMGCPVFLTVDQQTLEDQTFTVRDRQTRAQRRMVLEEFLREFEARDGLSVRRFTEVQ